MFAKLTLFEFHFSSAFPTIFFTPFPFHFISDINISATDIVVQQSFESHLSMSDDTRKAVQMNLLNIDHYHHEKLYASEKQIVNLNRSLRDIDEDRCHALSESFCI